MSHASCGCDDLFWNRKVTRREMPLGTAFLYHAIVYMTLKSVICYITQGLGTPCFHGIHTLIKVLLCHSWWLKLIKCPAVFTIILNAESLSIYQSMTIMFFSSVSSLFVMNECKPESIHPRTVTSITWFICSSVHCIIHMIPQLPLPKNINEKDDKGCNDASSPLYNLSYSIQQEREELAGNGRQVVPFSSLWHCTIGIYFKIQETCFSSIVWSLCQAWAVNILLVRIGAEGIALGACNVENTPGPSAYGV